MEIKAELIGKCGIYCGACPLHIGGICKGCSDINTTKCLIYKCVNERNLNSYGECPEFPCEMLKSHPGVVKFKCIENLEEIKEKGLKEWLEKQWG